MVFIVGKYFEVYYFGSVILDRGRREFWVELGWEIVFIVECRKVLDLYWELG